MALKLELNVKMAQQLVMTPQLQMAIKLLQMTKMELTELINQEMEQNPVLDETENSIDTEAEEEFIGGVDETADGKAEIPEGSESDIIVAQDLKKTIEEVKQEPAETEMDWDTFFDKYMDGPSEIMPRVDRDDERPQIDSYYSKESNLFDYLVWQLKFSNFSDELKTIGEEIIGNINDDGYLKSVTLEEIAEKTETDVKDVERIHSAITRFDPIGVASRDLQECLFVQSKFGEFRNPLTAKIIKNHWDLVKKRNVVKLARVLKITKEEVGEAMRVIQSLDPKPGSQYISDRPEYITPDIYVVKIGEEYHVMLNEDGLPKLKLNKYYQKSLGAGSNNTETKNYIKDKLRSAAWLIKSIQQRQRTIFKVTESIVEQQKEFLEKGVEYLKPMILRNVAEDIDMHECTVSRVTTNKYVHTPQGIFELKYFFNSGITSQNGEDFSSESIKTKIRQLIEAENPKKPLSDQKIMDLLKQDGIDVARRTVAKYREAMGILSSSGRRKKF